VELVTQTVGGRGWGGVVCKVKFTNTPLVAGAVGGRGWDEQHAYIFEINDGLKFLFLINIFLKFCPHRLELVLLWSLFHMRASNCSF
jgi:hypothetical protein